MSIHTHRMCIGSEIFVYYCITIYCSYFSLKKEVFRTRNTFNVIVFNFKTEPDHLYEYVVIFVIFYDY